MLNSESSPAKPAAMPAIVAFCVGVELVEADVGQADQLAGEDFLQHRRGHADHADARRDVQAEHPPDQPELRRLVRVVQMNVVLRDHRIGLCRRRPALGPPAGRRNAIAERADHHEHEVDHAHRDEGFPDADRGRGLEIVHQQVGQRRADHGAAAEAHDGHAGRHAAAIGEPFHQRRHRRDVAEAKADAADHAGAEPQQPELMRVDADRAEEQTAAPAQRRHEARLARSDALEPAAPHRGGDAEQHEEQRVHPAHAGDLPVAGGGEEFLDQRHVGARLRRVQAERARQRQPEHAEAVGHADAQMNAKRRRRHQPAIEAGGRDRPLFVKESRSGTGYAPGATD